MERKLKRKRRDTSDEEEEEEKRHRAVQRRSLYEQIKSCFQSVENKINPWFINLAFESAILNTLDEESEKQQRNEALARKNLSLLKEISPLLFTDQKFVGQFLTHALSLPEYRRTCYPPIQDKKTQEECIAKIQRSHSVPILAMAAGLVEKSLPGFTMSILRDLEDLPLKTQKEFFRFLSRYAYEKRPTIKGDLPAIMPAIAKCLELERKRQSMLAPPSLFRPKIAILFLAPNGIAQPQWWQDWRVDSQVEKQILFYILTDNSENIPKNNQWKVILLSFRPLWCDLTQVFALKRGIEVVLQDDKKEEIQCIYFVSGQEVPVISADRLYQQPYVTRFYGSVKWSSLNFFDDDPKEREARGGMGISIRESVAFADLSLSRTGMVKFASVSNRYIEYLNEQIQKKYTNLSGKLVTYIKELVIQREDLEKLIQSQNLGDIYGTTSNFPEEAVNWYRKQDYKGAPGVLDHNGKFTQAFNNTLHYYLEQTTRQIQMFQNILKEERKNLTMPCPDETLPILINSIVDPRSDEYFQITGRYGGGDVSPPLAVARSMTSPATFFDWDRPYWQLVQDKNTKIRQNASFREWIKQMCTNETHFSPEKLLLNFLTKRGIVLGIATVAS